MKSCVQGDYWRSTAYFTVCLLFFISILCVLLWSLIKPDRFVSSFVFSRRFRVLISRWKTIIGEAYYDFAFQVHIWCVQRVKVEIVNTCRCVCASCAVCSGSHSKVAQVENAHLHLCRRLGWEVHKERRHLLLLCSRRAPWNYSNAPSSRFFSCMPVKINWRQNKNHRKKKNKYYRYVQRNVSTPHYFVPGWVPWSLLRTCILLVIRHACEDGEKGSSKNLKRNGVQQNRSTEREKCSRREVQQKWSTVKGKYRKREIQQKSTVKKKYIQQMLSKAKYP